MHAKKIFQSFKEKSFEELIEFQIGIMPVYANHFTNVSGENFN